MPRMNSMNVLLPRNQKPVPMILKIYLLFVLTLLCGCHGDWVEIGDKGYVYACGTIAKTIKEGVAESVIEKEVLNYAFDDNYIVVYQVPNEYFIKELERGLPQRKIDSLEQKFQVMRKIHDCYWIIDMNTDRVLGPMNKNDFEKKCHSLQVTAQLDPKYEKKPWSERRKSQR